ncbi:MAG: glycosyl hydrolase [Sediminibacterium sp.]|nr:glycosyl hydrolase [Sediminibacterium sp.]
MLKRNLIIISLLLSMSVYAQTSSTADPNATRPTKNLFRNLMKTLPEGILFGHQDDLAYGMGWTGVPGKSTIKDAVGEYPAVYGWELGNIELGDLHNLDSISFDKMKDYIREGYKRGGVITISWHANHPVTGGNAWDTTHGALDAIIPGGARHEIFKLWLDRLANFMLDLKTEKGELIPVIFRPYHEFTGNWFWWCQNTCTPDEFKELWQFTYTYFTENRGVHNLLWAYNPEKYETREQYLERYPGDKYVDILSLDMYQYGDPANSDVFETSLHHRLGILTAIAKEKNKIPALAETGFLNIPYAQWFTQKLMKGIGDHQLSYILLWRDGGYVNGPEKGSFIPSQDHFIPVGSDPAFWDFQQLYQSGKFLFQKKAARLKLYE